MIPSCIHLSVLGVNQYFFTTSLFTSVGSSEALQKPPPSGSWDLNELLSEIRHLRLQLEKSIQTNTALREKLEEQLLKGAHRSETININYLLSSPGTQRSPSLVLYMLERLIVTVDYSASTALLSFLCLDEGGRSPGREGSDSLHRSFHSHNKCTSALYGKKP